MKATDKITKLVDECKRLFGGLDRIPDAAAERLIAILDKSPVEALEILCREKVRFCHMIARTRLVRDHGYTWEQIKAIEAR